MSSEISKQLDSKERERAENMAALEGREPVGRQFHQQWAIHTHQANAQGELDQHIYTEPGLSKSLADDVARRLQAEAEQRRESPLYYSVLPAEAMPV